MILRLPLDSPRGPCQPLVSVCLPTIGRIEYLHQTQASLSHQSYSNFEVLVLDNASPEPARQFLRDYETWDPRVRVMRTSERISMFANFNRGVRSAFGEYIIFCHDDDVYLPDFIERYVDMFARNPNVGFAGSNLDLIDTSSRVLERRRQIARTEVWGGRRFIQTLFRRGRNVTSTPGIMFRRAALEGGFDESLSIHFGDFVILMRIAETWDVGLLAKTLWRNRRHAEQASGAVPISQSVPLRTEILRRYCAEFAARWPAESTLVRGLERSLDRTHRLGLLWGWASAPHRSEADACLTQLRNSGQLERLCAALRAIDLLGIRPMVRRRFVAPILRKLGSAAGF